MLNFVDLTTQIANEMASLFKLTGEALIEYTELVKRYVNGEPVSEQDIEKLRSTDAQQAFRKLKLEV